MQMGNRNAGGLTLDPSPASDGTADVSTERLTDSAQYPSSKKLLSPLEGGPHRLGHLTKEPGRLHKEGEEDYPKGLLSLPGAQSRDTITRGQSQDTVTRGGQSQYTVTRGGQGCDVPVSGRRSQVSEASPDRLTVHQGQGHQGRPSHPTVGQTCAGSGPDEMLRNSSGKRIYTRKHLEESMSTCSSDRASTASSVPGSPTSTEHSGASSQSARSGRSAGGARRHKLSSSSSGSLGGGTQRRPSAEDTGSDAPSSAHLSSPDGGCAVRQLSLNSHGSDVFEDHASLSPTSVTMPNSNLLAPASPLPSASVTNSILLAPVAPQEGDQQVGGGEQGRGNGALAPVNRAHGKVEKLTGLSINRPVPRRWGSRRQSQMSAADQLSTRVALDEAVRLIQRKKLGPRKIREQNIMMRAVDAGHLECVRQCIQAGCSVNSKHTNGTPAIIYAVRSDNNASQVLKVLLEAGAKADQPSVSEETALCSAIMHKDPECVRLLLEAGANVNAPWQGTTPINLAIQTMNQYITAIILHAGAEVTHLPAKSGDHNPMHHLLRLFHKNKPTPNLASAMWITLQADGRAVSHLHSFTSNIPGYSSQQLIYRMSEAGLWTGGGVGSGAARHITVWLVRLGYQPDRGEKLTVKAADPAVHDWMEDYVAGPPPLVDLCVRTIRENMVGNCVYSAKRLGDGLKESIKKQLLLEEWHGHHDDGDEEEDEDPYYSFLMMDGEGGKDGQGSSATLPPGMAHKKQFTGDIRGVTSSPKAQLRRGDSSDYETLGGSTSGEGSSRASSLIEQTVREEPELEGHEATATEPTATSSANNTSGVRQWEQQRPLPLVGGAGVSHPAHRSSSDVAYQETWGTLGGDRRTSADTRDIESALNELDSTLDAFNMSGGGRDTDTESERSQVSSPLTASAHRPSSVTSSSAKVMTPSQRAPSLSGDASAPPATPTASSGPAERPPSTWESGTKTLPNVKEERQADVTFDPPEHRSRPYVLHDTLPASSGSLSTGPADCGPSPVARRRVSPPGGAVSPQNGVVSPSGGTGPLTAAQSPKSKEPSHSGLGDTSAVSLQTQAPTGPTPTDRCEKPTPPPVPSKTRHSRPPQAPAQINRPPQVTNRPKKQAPLPPKRTTSTLSPMNSVVTPSAMSPTLPATPPIAPVTSHRQSSTDTSPPLSTRVPTPRKAPNDSTSSEPSVKPTQAAPHMDFTPSSPQPRKLSNPAAAPAIPHPLPRSPCQTRAPIGDKTVSKEPPPPVKPKPPKVAPKPKPKPKLAGQEKEDINANIGAREFRPVPAAT